MVALTAGFLAGLGAGGYALLQRLRLQMHRDLIFYRYTVFSEFGYGGSPAFDPGQSDSWFPLTYPVLARWGGSADPSRRSYAFYTLQSHGLPYSRWWLEDRLRQNSAQFFAPAALFGGYDYSSGQEIAPQYELFGLDRPESVQRLTELALAGIQADSPEWSFNLNWLNSLLTQEEFPLRDQVYRALLPALESSSPQRAKKLLSALPYEEERIPSWALSQVQAVRQRVAGNVSPYTDVYGRAGQVLILEQPTVQTVRPLYEDLPPPSRHFFLLQIADPETLPPAAQVLLRSVVGDDADPQRFLAAALLYLKGDPSGEPLLQKALNEDFASLHGIDDHLVLLQLAEAFPNSRFTQACWEYARIRGGQLFWPFPLQPRDRRTDPAAFPPGRGSGVGEVLGVVDVGPQSMQRDPPLPRPFGAGNLGPVQTPGNLDFDPLYTCPLGPLDHLAHDAAKGNPPFQLLGNVFRQQGRLGIGTGDLYYIDANGSLATTS